MCWSLTHRLKRMDWSCVTISTGDNSGFRSLSLNVAFSAGRSNQFCWIQWPVQKDILGVRNKCNISASTAWVYYHAPLFLIKTWSVARASMLPAHLKHRLSYVSTMMRCYRLPSSSSFTLLKLDSSQVQSRMSLRSFNHITRQVSLCVSACNVRVMAGIEKFSAVKW